MRTIKRPVKKYVETITVGDKVEVIEHATKPNEKERVFSLYQEHGSGFAYKLEEKKGIATMSGDTFLEHATISYDVEETTETEEN